MKFPYTLTVIVGIVVLGVLSFFSTMGADFFGFKLVGNAITADEVTYIPSGFYYAKTGRYFFNPEHPPLIKDLAALPLLVLDPLLPVIKSIAPSSTLNDPGFPYTQIVFPKERELQNKQWYWGKLFLFNQYADTETIIAWSRGMMLAVNALLLVLLYASLRRPWGDRASALGVLLCALLPTTIAYSSLVILDLTTALLQILALVWSGRALYKIATKQGSGGAWFLALLFLFFANAAKVSSLLLFPVIWLGGTVWLFSVRVRVKKIIYFWIIFGGIVFAVGMLLLGYYFVHTVAMTVPEILLQLDTLLAHTPREVWLKNLLTTLLSVHPFFRGGVEYLLGLALTAKRAHEAVQTTYFMNHFYRSEGPGGWYYPVLMVTKIPFGLFVLLFFSVLLTARAGCKKIWLKIKGTPIGFWKTVSPVSVLFLFFGVSYFFLAATARLQMGIRYVLPSVFVLVLCIGRLSSRFWEEKFFLFKIKYLIGGVCISLFVSLSLTFPFYLSYYNFLGGGIENGYRIATDSTYDWGGQDLKRLAEWVRVHQIGVLYGNFFAFVPEYYLGTAYRPLVLEAAKLPPSGADVAISAQQYQFLRFSSSTTGALLQRYFPLEKMQARVGTTMFIFKMP